MGLNERMRTDEFDEGKIIYLLDMMSSVTSKISEAYCNLNEFDKAEQYCRQSISYIKQKKVGKKQREDLFEKLSLLGECYFSLGKKADIRAVRLVLGLRLGLGLGLEVLGRLHNFC
jgi:hypothetical protein